MPTPVVIDLSHHNVIEESLKPAAQSGIMGCIHKATEGASWDDPKYEARRWLAKEAGMKWGAYHFLRPGSMEAQAGFFLNVAAPDDDTLVACDYEDPAIGLNQVLYFMRTLEDVSGRSPVLYSGHVLKEKLRRDPMPELAKYRLWIAQYGPKPVLPRGWSDYFLWQFTEHGEVLGITPPTDLNSSPLSSHELSEGWAGRPPPPLQPPGPHVVTDVRLSLTIRIEADGPVTITAPEGVDVTLLGQPGS